MAKFTYCWLNRHVPAEGSAKWDGEHYLGTCAKCGKRILRYRKGVWKRTRISAKPTATGS